MAYNKKWIVKEQDEEKIARLRQEFGISRLAAVVLQNRRDELGDFRRCIWHDPFLLSGMDRAVARIRQAVEGRERMTVYGDYDADGVTSTVVLYSYLKEKGAVVDYYIPDRIEEGYGINPGALEAIARRGTSLIITVDTGITAVDEIAHAAELGMDVIVTDHHQCKDRLPRCCAVIDPKQPGCPYPFKELAGVGVTFKLVCALEGERGLSDVRRRFMPLVCLGTVADVVPLIDENRSFVREGLSLFPHSGICGIDALLASVNLQGRPVSAGQIGFIIAPRINAAGRLGQAEKSVELFLSGDRAHCLSIARELSEENRLRQSLEQQILEEAIEIIEKNRLQDQKVIVVAGTGWHQGVIGIVSSKITEKYYRPSILISLDGESGKASGRSIPGFNLFEALADSADTLLRFGGHALAAGLSIEGARVAEFRGRINAYARENLSAEALIPPLHIDAVISPQDISKDSVAQLGALEPYGMGNAAPVFALSAVRVSAVTTMSDGKHLKMALQSAGFEIEAVGFHMGELAARLRRGDSVHAAGTLGINTYRDVSKVQMILKDLKK